MSKTFFVPIYERDGNELIAPHFGWLSEDRQDAHDIALGTMMVECILLGIKFTGEIREFETGDDGQGEIPHVKVGCGPHELLCIKGPLLDEARAEPEG